MATPDEKPEEWKPSPKPPLGRVRLLHQAVTGTGVCMYCGKAMDDWQDFDAPRPIDFVTTFPRPLEECPARRSAT